jgi:short-subunit dehydrogenase
MRNIVITGASGGLGTALAATYAAPGMTLGLLGRDAARLQDTAEQCRKLGAQTVIGQIDVTDTDGMAKWLNEFDSAYPIDLIIANAGISAGTGGGAETLDQIKHIFGVNVTGVMNTIHPVIDRMVARGQGQVAIVSSIAGFRGASTAPAYTTSKATVRVYGQALQGLLQPKGITLSVICPGFIRTHMTDVNPFPMPFIMEADQAAQIIKRKLAQKKNLIVFPWIMGAMAKLQNLLPDRLVNWIYSCVPAKPSE